MAGAGGAAASPANSINEPLQRRWREPPHVRDGRRTSPPLTTVQKNFGVTMLLA